MHQNKRKILYKQILVSENRCTKMSIDIHTKQIGNCLDNLVLAEQAPQFMKTLLKRNSEKSHISHKVSQEGQIIYSSQSCKLGKEGHVNFYNHTLTHVNGTVTIELKP
jgi:hypothetical protein